MKKIIFSSCIVALLALSSCSSIQYSARQTNINRQDIVMAPTIVDVQADYTKRVEVTSDWCETKEAALNECKYLAITTKKIDIVVDPIYRVEYNKKKARKRYKATVTGFAGYYTNSRTMYEDIDLLKNFTREDIEKYLILHKPEVLQYMNQPNNGVTINHMSGPCPEHPRHEQPAPQPSQQDARPASTSNKKK